MISTLIKPSHLLVQRLAEHNHQLVLAESCTAGLVASSLAGVPGASSVLAGSAVVYQVRTKQQWLGLSEDHFRDFDVVSAETSAAMAHGVLNQTPWATVAAAITGHLGPDAPEHLDGIAWVSVITKSGASDENLRTEKLLLDTKPTAQLSAQQLSAQQLSAQQLSAQQLSALHRRHERQISAAEQLMDLVLNTIDAA